MDPQPYSRPTPVPPPIMGAQLPNSAAGGEAERDGPAWEWHRDLGAWRALWLTVKEILAQPTAAFRRMRRTGGYNEPLFFYLIMEIAVGFAEFWITLPSKLFVQNRLMMYADQSGALQRLLSYFPPEIQTQIRSMVTEQTSVLGQFVGWAVRFPFSTMLTLIIAIAATHICLLVLGSARQGLETTFRATVYSKGATAPLRLIPVLGPILVPLVIWPIVYIIALAETHEISASRATLAVILPGLIVIFLFFILALLVLAFISHMGGLSSIGNAFQQ